jgi:hypothetical protein
VIEKVQSVLDAITDDTQKHKIGPTNADLAAISDLAEQQLALEAEVTALNEQLKLKTEQLRRISEQTLPDAMTAVGLAEFKLVDGSKITVKDDVAASIRVEHTAAAVAWLDGQGFGDVVKDEIKINLGRGESGLAEEFAALARSLSVDFAEKLSVHSQTLKALVKEQMAAGVEFPPDYFNVYAYRKASIKAPKVKVMS